MRSLFYIFCEAFFLFVCLCFVFCGVIGFFKLLAVYFDPLEIVFLWYKYF